MSLLRSIIEKACGHHTLTTDQQESACAVGAHRWAGT